MKKFLIAAMAMILVGGGASVTFAQARTQQLIDATSTWSIWLDTDNEVTGSITEGEAGGTLNATITLPADSDNGNTDVWPSGSVSSGFGNETGAFENLESIQIEYSAVETWRIDLSIPELSDNGTNYRKALEAGSNKNVTINVSDFARPGYVDDTDSKYKKGNIAPHLGDVITFSIVAVSGEAKTCEIEVTSIILTFGAGNNTGGDNNGNTGGDNNGNTGGGDGYIELVGYEYADWSSYVEKEDEDQEFWDGGSRVNITTQNPLKASLKLGVADEDTEKWVWLGLLFWLGDFDYSTLTKIEITYKADKALQFTYGAENKTSTKNLTASDNFKTESITISSTVAASFGRAAGFTFTHEVENQTVELEVTSVKLYGVSWGGDGDGGGDTPISKLKSGKTAPISISGIKAGKIGLNVPTTGNYSVAIYSVDGKMLAQTKANLVKGVNSLAIGKNLAKGVAIVRVQGANAALVKKISIK